ncbi:EscU/YscU/HrcU family type III secretion system export apparatus switch protein [Isoptericola sp. b441]|uniref:EscU/YscU/HrcU family type III secretion system export apparatus switch protein n=1 Tax=Actinotalea lenta TaxID=3064654 RepID=A0ABT9D7B6_9CELL|nr:MULTISPECIES: EscU/YscU/HrcU family type III secretion system export apparatus switch protein [unclassified Isoptericola]MDO8106104.1 EscU/YscU/HrcU family type III secretion system export apparatus switch protein [Isoptericola sp. b441]MDO8122177.1 EscU/YscU/HrcU family type III secretion system export apparatus switch protein [Isoptericola sp. b490]
MSNDAQERTEKATPKRMKELRRDGALQKSQDLSAWLGVGVGALVLPMVASSASSAGRRQLETVRDVIANPDVGSATKALSDGLGSIISTLAPLLGAVVLAAVVASAAQGGVHVSGKRLKPKFEQFNIAKGAKRVFGMQSLWQGAKAALKTAAIGAVLWSVVQGMVPLMLGSGTHSLSSVLTAASGGVSGLVRTAVLAGLVLAAFDVFVIAKRNRKKTRMSKKEIKDEQKQSDGDPLVKGQIRSRQLAMSRNRMIASVADADVVLVNPTHVAVALRYQPGSGAPKVVAKGAGHVAARIRKEAADKRVPMVEDVPLARALHAACEIGHEIPAHLYVAVARVLAFVMALRRRGSAQGIHRAPGGPTTLDGAVAA